MSKAGDQVWEMLSFQYKPLEKNFLKDIEGAKQAKSKTTRNVAEKMEKKYKNGNSTTKIAMLDRYAAFLGL